MSVKRILDAVRGGCLLQVRVAVAAVTVVGPTLFYFLLVDAWGLFPQFLFFELRNRLYGSLYLVTFVVTALLLPWRAYAIVWLAAFMIHLPRSVRYSLSVEYLVGNLAFWFLPLLAGALVALERQWRARQRHMFTQRQVEREEYLRRILVVQEEERLKIAQELHDEPLQDLIALAYMAEVAVDEIPETSEQAREKITWMREQCVRISQELRRITYDLRPSILDELGLVPAVRWLVERTKAEAQVQTELVVEGPVERLDKHVEVSVFRVVQEALTNVRRHSCASRACVRLVYSARSLSVQVEDNGRGFLTKGAAHRSAAKGHFGIMGMKERAAAIGGVLTVRSSQENGTVVSLVVHLQPRSTS